MRKLNVWLLASALVGCLAFTACNNSNRNPNDDATVESPNDTSVGDQGDDSEYNEERADLREDIQDAQKDIDDRIADLRKKMDTASAEAKVEINQQIEKLEARSIQLSADLDRLGQDMGDGWETFKMNVRKTLSNLEEEIEEEL